MHALYRRRSAFDDMMLDELVELSLSPYTRIRRLVNIFAKQSLADISRIDKHKAYFIMYQV